MLCGWAGDHVFRGKGSRVPRIPFMMPTPASISLPGGKKMRVLIVEDHGPTRLAMGRLIRDAGADVVTARDGEEGLGYLLTQRFDVLLTDLRMPVMDGFELVHHCLQLPRLIEPDA